MNDIIIPIPKGTWVVIASNVTTFNYLLTNKYIFDQCPRVYHIVNSNSVPMNLDGTIIVEMDGRRGEYSTSVTFNNDTPKNIYVQCQYHDGEVIL